MSSSYLVNEIYPCLQGEGPCLGVPSVLVRFQICNLRCRWCDTPYTHTFHSDPTDPNHPKGTQNFTRVSLEDLVTKITSFSQDHFILSGGEPTLQNLGLLMREVLKKKHASFEVESNGTRIPHKNVPGFLESDYILAQWNISPKFSNAGEEINPEALSHWAALSQTQCAVYFKYVIRDEFFSEDLNEVLSQIQRFSIPHTNVLLMPEGTTSESQLSKVALHDACLKYGFRYTPRLHVLLFGNTRGI
jgi:7-carboxy-7-deazaguanine synthase